MAKRTYAAIDFVSHADNDYNVIPDDDSTPNPASTRKKLRWQLKYVPWALTVERISVFISFVCLVTAISWRAAAANRSDFKVRKNRRGGKTRQASSCTREHLCNRYLHFPFDTCCLHNIHSIPGMALLVLR